MRKLDTSFASAPMTPPSSNALPQGWCWAAIGALAAEERNSLAIGPFGSNLKVSDYTSDGVPLVFVRNIRSGRFGGIDTQFVSSEKAEELSSHSIEPGDILITKMGDPPGDACIYPTDRPLAIITADCIKFRPSILAGDRRFFTYAIQSPVVRDSIVEITTGVAQQKVSLARFSRIFIPVAPANEQRRIVAKIEELFSDLDAGVAALERVRANLKRYRASVLKAAVEGKLTEDWRAQHPDTELASVLLERILTERRRQWEKNQLAKFAQAVKQPPKGWQQGFSTPKVAEVNASVSIPGGWAWASLSLLGELDRGRSRHRPRNAPHLYGGRYPFIQTGDIRHARTFVRDYSQTYSEAGLAQSRLWQAGTLCITIAANIAETAILSFDACFPDSVVGFLADDTHVSVRYAELYLRTIQSRLESIAPATAQKNINLEVLTSLPVLVPPRVEQDEIVAEVDRRLSVVDEIEAQVDANLKRAARLRQGILKRAFEGRLVPQDPTDEPADKLLARIWDSRQSSDSTPVARKQRRSKTAGDDSARLPFGADSNE